MEACVDKLFFSFLFVVLFVFFLVVFWYLVSEETNCSSFSCELLETVRDACLFRFARTSVYCRVLPFVSIEKKKGLIEAATATCDGPVSSWFRMFR